MTTAKRTYLSCATCGKDCIGRYKDDEGKPLCKGCGTPKKPGHMSLCTRCQRVHYDIEGTGLCRRCRTAQILKKDTRRCTKCGGYIRHKLSMIDECMGCMGNAQYQRLRKIDSK